MLRHISHIKNSLASDEDSTSLKFSSLFRDTTSYKIHKKQQSEQLDLPNSP